MSFVGFPLMKKIWGHGYELLTRAPVVAAGAIVGADGNEWAPDSFGPGLFFYNGANWIRCSNATSIQIDGGPGSLGNYNFIGDNGISIVQDGEDVTIGLAALQGGGQSSNYSAAVELPGQLAITTTDVPIVSVGISIVTDTEAAILDLEGFLTAGVDAVDVKVVLSTSAGVLASPWTQVFVREITGGGAWQSADATGVFQIPAGETWAVRATGTALVSGASNPGLSLAILGSKVTLDTTLTGSLFSKRRQRAWQE